jgi:hypothetical protein
MEAEIDVQIQSIDDVPLIIEISKQMNRKTFSYTRQSGRIA